MYAGSHLEELESFCLQGVRGQRGERRAQAFLGEAQGVALPQAAFWENETKTTTRTQKDWLSTLGSWHDQWVSDACKHRLLALDADMKITWCWRNVSPFIATTEKCAVSQSILCSWGNNCALRNLLNINSPKIKMFFSWRNNFSRKTVLIEKKHDNNITNRFLIKLPDDD